MTAIRLLGAITWLIVENDTGGVDDLNSTLEMNSLQGCCETWLCGYRTNLSKI